jgi:hypothetical protein
MRTPNILLALLIVSFVCLAPSAALSQPKRASNLSEFTPRQTSRQDASQDKRSLARGPSGELRNFDQSEDMKAMQRPKDPYTPLYALLLVLFLALCCAPVAIKLHGDHKKRLAAESSFGRNSGGSPAKDRFDTSNDGPSDKLATLDTLHGEENKPSVPLVSPDELRDRVWNTLLDAQKWLSVEGVARLAKLDPEQTRGELQELAQEGHIEKSKDRTGRPIYKMPG